MKLTHTLAHTFAHTLTLAALLAPAAALAQRTPRHELGIDASVAFYSRGDFDIGTGEVDGGSGLQIGAPVDVRIGFLAPGAVSFEPRFRFNFVTNDGSSSLAFSPTLNVLYQAGKRAMLQRGLYVTGGVGINIQRFAANDDAETYTQPSVNVGVGTRSSINQGAFRPEGFLEYMFASDAAPSLTRIGARLGVSFWR